MHSILLQLLLRIKKKNLKGTQAWSTLSREEAKGYRDGNDFALACLQGGVQ